MSAAGARWTGIRAARRSAPRDGAPKRGHTLPKRYSCSVSPAERSNSRRRQPRRRGSAGNGGKPRMRTVRETSAGGLVVDGLDGPSDQRSAALIGRTDRRGRLLWSLPKGHIEEGETSEQTAIREVAEETGINGEVVAELGSIDYWFVTEGRRVHKTVHHFLLRSLGGELSDADVEVTQVAWVPLSELDSRLAYADERRLAEVANRLIDRMETGKR
ncbi:NUDIX hydrolase [Nocardia thailandica]